jgi:hypothetical protein
LSPVTLPVKYNLDNSTKLYAAPKTPPTFSYPKTSPEEYKFFEVPPKSFPLKNPH